MMPDLVAYGLGGVLILVSLGGIITTVMTRSRKRWADATPKV
ncbi:MAG TPA: hypothetical protein VIW21_05745 [Chthoniobacterales bacterium]